MASGLAGEIKNLEIEKKMSHEEALKFVEDFMLAAYKRKFGTVEGVEIKFSEDESKISVQVKKKIVDDVIDEATEIDIEDALKYDDNCEIGDELLIPVDLSKFGRMEVQSAKQVVKQTINSRKNADIYKEFIDKKGEMIVGYFQREHNGNIYIDLGKTEGILPKRFQSPREAYKVNDRIKTLIYEVEKNDSGVSIVLSRTHTDFVKKLFELEVPEVADKTIEIFKIVREPGYRVKMSVYTNREDIDPVGACVGLKGARIQAVVREMEGEKIDVVKYDVDPSQYIKNALSPAEVKDVYIIDKEKRLALAVVSESQLSLAIGKQGLNVRLANRLVDWNIDVKTEAQFQEMDIHADVKKAVDNLFTEDNESEEITRISELKEIPMRLIAVLAQNNIVDIEDFISTPEKKLLEIPGFTKEDFELVRSIIEENVDIVDEDIEPVPEDENEEIASEDEEEQDISPEDEEELYECPECGKPIKADVTCCPHCGIELTFEEVDDDEDADEKNSENEEK